MSGRFSKGPKASLACFRFVWIVLPASFPPSCKVFNPLKLVSLTSANSTSSAFVIFTNSLAASASPAKNLRLVNFKI